MTGTPPTQPPPATGRVAVRLHLRLDFPSGARIGPGKIDLLQAIGRTGSISAAAREMGMSYRRAWLLVDALNRMFDQPLVIASAGGISGGGATLTSLAEQVIGTYRRIHAAASTEAGRELAPVAAHVKAADAG